MYDPEWQHILFFFYRWKTIQMSFPELSMALCEIWWAHAPHTKTHGSQAFQVQGLRPLFRPLWPPCSSHETSRAQIQVNTLLSPSTRRTILVMTHLCFFGATLGAQFDRHCLWVYFWTLPFNFFFYGSQRVVGMWLVLFRHARCLELCCQDIVLSDRRLIVDGI